MSFLFSLAQPNKKTMDGFRRCEHINPYAVRCFNKSYSVTVSRCDTVSQVSRQAKCQHAGVFHPFCTDNCPVRGCRENRLLWETKPELMRASAYAAYVELIEAEARLAEVFFFFFFFLLLLLTFSLYLCLIICYFRFIAPLLLLRR